MRNKTKQYTLIGIVAGLWLLGLIISILWCVLSDKGNGPDILITAISALFSGIALIVAYRGIYQQSNDLNKQIDVDIFTRSISEIIDSNRFRDARIYILSSNEYYRDLNTLKKILEHDNVNLTEWKDLCYKNKPHKQIDPDVRSRLRKSYEKIIYFCSKMEYLGVICDKQVAGNIIIEYYGQTITESYDILKSLITSDTNTAQYFHYQLLYNKTQKDKSLRDLIQKYIIKIQSKR